MQKNSNPSFNLDYLISIFYSMFFVIKLLFVFEKYFLLINWCAYNFCITFINALVFVAQWLSFHYSEVKFRSSFTSVLSHLNVIKVEVLITM